MKKSFLFQIAIFAALIFGIAGCSNINSRQTSSVSFTFDEATLSALTARSALSRGVDDGDTSGNPDQNGMFIQIALFGDGETKLNSVPVAHEAMHGKLEVAFDDVTVGQKVYARAIVYMKDTYTDEATGEPVTWLNLEWYGETARREVAAGDNELPLSLKSLWSAEPALDEPFTGYAENEDAAYTLTPYTDGSYIITDASEQPVSVGRYAFTGVDANHNPTSLAITETVYLSAGVYQLVTNPATYTVRYNGGNFSVPCGTGKILHFGAAVDSYIFPQKYESQTLSAWFGGSQQTKATWQGVKCDKIEYSAVFLFDDESFVITSHKKKFDDKYPLLEESVRYVMRGSYTLTGTFDDGTLVLTPSAMYLDEEDFDDDDDDMKLISAGWMALSDAEAKDNAMTCQISEGVFTPSADDMEEPYPFVRMIQAPVVYTGDIDDSDAEFEKDALFMATGTASDLEKFPGTFSFAAYTDSTYEVTYTDETNSVADKLVSKGMYEMNVEFGETESASLVLTETAYFAFDDMTSDALVDVKTSNPQTVDTTAGTFDFTSESGAVITFKVETEPVSFDFAINVHCTDTLSMVSLYAVDEKNANSLTETLASTSKTNAEKAAALIAVLEKTTSDVARLGAHDRFSGITIDEEGPISFTDSSEDFVDNTLIEEGNNVAFIALVKYRTGDDISNFYVAYSDVLTIDASENKVLLNAYSYQVPCRIYFQFNGVPDSEHTLVTALSDFKPDSDKDSLIANARAFAEATYTELSEQYQFDALGYYSSGSEIPCLTLNYKTFEDQLQTIRVSSENLTDDNTLSLMAGDNETVTVTATYITAQNKNGEDRMVTETDGVTTESSNATVAEAAFADGALVITGKKAGEATITVSLGDQTADITVTVIGEVITASGTAVCKSEEALAFFGEELSLNGCFIGLSDGTYTIRNEEKAVTVTVVGQEVDKTVPAGTLSKGSYELSEDGKTLTITEAQYYNLLSEQWVDVDTPTNQPIDISQGTLVFTTGYNVTVTFTVDGGNAGAGISVTLADVTPSATLTLTVSGTTITATEGFTAYTWTLEGNTLDVADSTSNTLDAASYCTEAGAYQLTCAAKNAAGDWTSATCMVNVTIE